VPELRRENNVGYGDGHVETHAQSAYVAEDGFIWWDGMGYVTYSQGFPYRFPY